MASWPGSSGPWAAAGLRLVSLTARRSRAGGGLRAAPEARAGVPLARLRCSLRAWALIPGTEAERGKRSEPPAGPSGPRAREPPLTLGAGLRACVGAAGPCPLTTPSHQRAGQPGRPGPRRVQGPRAHPARPEQPAHGPPSEHRTHCSTSSRWAPCGSRVAPPRPKPCPSPCPVPSRPTSTPVPARVC